MNREHCWIIRIQVRETYRSPMLLRMFVAEIIPFEQIEVTLVRAWKIEGKNSFFHDDILRKKWW